MNLIITQKAYKDTKGVGFNQTSVPLFAVINFASDVHLIK